MRGFEPRRHLRDLPHFENHDTIIVQNKVVSSTIRQISLKIGQNAEKSSTFPCRHCKAKAFSKINPEYPRFKSVFRIFLESRVIRRKYYDPERKNQARGGALP